MKSIMIKIKVISVFVIWLISLMLTVFFISAEIKEIVPIIFSLLLFLSATFILSVVCNDKNKNIEEYDNI